MAVSSTGAGLAGGMAKRDLVARVPRVVIESPPPPCPPQLDSVMGNGGGGVESVSPMDMSPTARATPSYSQVICPPPPPPPPQAFTTTSSSSSSSSMSGIDLSSRQSSAHVLADSRKEGGGKQTNTKKHTQTHIPEPPRYHTFILPNPQSRTFALTHSLSHPNSPPPTHTRLGGIADEVGERVVDFRSDREGSEDQGVAGSINRTGGNAHGMRGGTGGTHTRTHTPTPTPTPAHTHTHVNTHQHIHALTEETRLMSALMSLQISDANFKDIF